VTCPWLAAKPADDVRKRRATGEAAGESPGEQVWVIGGGPHLQEMQNISFPHAPSLPNPRAQVFSKRQPAFAFARRQRARRPIPSYDGVKPTRGRRYL